MSFTPQWVIYSLRFLLVVASLQLWLVLSCRWLLTALTFAVLGVKPLNMLLSFFTWVSLTTVLQLQRCFVVVSFLDVSTTGLFQEVVFAVKVKRARLSSSWYEGRWNVSQGWRRGWSGFIFVFAKIFSVCADFSTGQKLLQSISFLQGTLEYRRH